jgi:hypothetical protein
VDAVLEWVQGALAVCEGGLVANGSVSSVSSASAPAAPRLHFIRCLRVPIAPAQTAWNDHESPPHCVPRNWKPLARCVLETFAQSAPADRLQIHVLERCQDGLR